MYDTESISVAVKNFIGKFSVKGKYDFCLNAVSLFFYTTIKIPKIILSFDKLISHKQKNYTSNQFEYAVELFRRRSPSH